MRRRELLKSFFCLSAATALRRLSWAQGPLTLQILSDEITLLSGGGGNIAIVSGADGLLLVDSGVPEAAEGVVAKAAEVSKRPITILINTHWHFDHVGGNARIGKGGARIIAHENTKKRLVTKQRIAFFQRDFDPLPPEGQPAVTFTDQGTLLHAADKIRYTRLPPAHTDGDTVIHFQNDNIFQTGDLMFNGLYPFIDYSSGGSIEGMIANADRIMKMVDSKTKIIPGHGPLATKDDVKVFRDMLADVNRQISSLIKANKTIDQILAAEPTKAYDEKWGKQFLKPADFVRMLYQGKTVSLDSR